MTSEELMTLQAFGNGRKSDMSSFENFMVADKTSKRPSGTAIAGLVVGGGALLVGIGAWIFGPIYAAGRVGATEKLIESHNAHTREMQTLLATTLAAERNERIGYQNSNSPSVKEYISVSQQGTQQASATSSALAQAEATLLAGALTGQVQQCPQKVSLYSAPQPCPCPGSCCG